VRSSKARQRTRPLDPRLLRYASAARGGLALTVAAGLAGTGLILAQAGLLARVLSSAATGTSVAVLAAPLITLGAVLLARAALSYGGEAAALRAAATVKSQLRRHLLDRALRLSADDRDPAAQNQGSQNQGSQNQGSQNQGSQNQGSQNQGSQNQGSQNQGSQDRGSQDPGTQQPGDQGAELATLATRGLDGLDAYFGRYLPQLVLACLVPLAVVIRVGLADWPSGVIIAVTLPLVPVFAVLVGLQTRARTRQQWTQLARLGGHFLDVVEGLPTLRVFGRGRAQEATIADMTSQYRTATMGTLRIAFLSALVLELTATLATALVAVEVGLRLLAGHIGYETALLVLLLTPEAFVPLRSASAQFHASIEGVTAADRVFQVLQAPPAGLAPAPGPTTPARRDFPLDLRRQVIICNEVALAYPDRRTPALSGVSLRIGPGDHIILAGPSGAGKSSLLALLLRFAEPTAGVIEVAGPDGGGISPPGPAPLNAIAAEAWLEQVAWVPQRPHLFDDTVAGNIALGRPGASFADIRRAARLAGAEEFIAGLEHGFQTLVGERGLRLSAGQRQQIALARAFLRDAPLLLLDEPTAHLDPLSAARVQESIAALAVGRTIVQVTHRAPGGTATARRLVLDDGRLVTSAAPRVIGPAGVPRLAAPAPLPRPVQAPP
jgi:ATP-binding cassette, subfamily C, bacterial CydD